MMSTNGYHVQAGPGNAPQSRESTQAASIQGSESTISCKSCRERKLRCDRKKPKCDTCTRLKHRCEYLARKRTVGPRRRYVEDSDSRLEQLKTRIESDQNMANNEIPDMIVNWNDPGVDMYLGLGLDSSTLMDLSFDTSLPILGGPPAGHFLPSNGIPGQQLMEIGLKEALPGQEMIDELHWIYFAKFHPLLPMIHKYRYYVSLDRAPLARPAICLRYAIWAIAASLSEKYKSFEDLLYERARGYIDASEMRGDGFVTIYHAQTWCLIAMYEAKRAHFSRSWMSAGRAVRLVQMLGLYSLDDDAGDAKRVLPPARDFIELEERRRTFWTAFYGDRWASVLTGWPMTINEDEHGLTGRSTPLVEALTPAGIEKISPFGCTILAAALYGHNHQHLHSKKPDDHAGDILNGKFWKRYRSLDSVISTTFLFLPDQLRLPVGLQDMGISFNHMTIHAVSISLHQGAIVAANKYNIDGDAIRHGQVRSLAAAQEITSIMRHISHEDSSKLSSWLGFCLYVAASVFIRDQKSGHPNPQGLSNLEYLMSAIQVIGHGHPIAKHFFKLLEHDVAVAGLDTYVDSVTHTRIWRVSNVAPKTHTVIDASGISMSCKPVAGDIWPPSQLERGEIGPNSSLLRSESAPHSFPSQSTSPEEEGNIAQVSNPFVASGGTWNRSPQFYPGFPSTSAS